MVLQNRYEKTGNKKLAKLSKWIYNLIVWIVPLVMIFIFYKKWDNISMVILVAIVWYLLLAIKASSDYVFDKNVNIDRISGRFGKLRRSYFRMVKQIPVIGKKKYSRFSGK